MTHAHQTPASFHASPAASMRALAALVVALTALVWSTAALAGGGNGAATITGSYADGCRDLTVHSSKNISFVVLQYADGRVVKDKQINEPDYARDGAAGDELGAALVKSGTTTETFTCPRTNDPPTAILELRTPPLSACNFNTTEHPTCLAWAPRTDWSRPAGGVLGFVFVFPVPPETLSFSFRGTSSTDPDNDVASWSIDFGDGSATSGSWATGSPGEIVHAYAAPFFGPNFPVVRLTVTDASGQSDSDLITLVGIDGTPD